MRMHRREQSIRVELRHRHPTPKGGRIFRVGGFVHYTPWRGGKLYGAKRLYKDIEIEMAWISPISKPIGSHRFRSFDIPSKAFDEL